MPTTGDRFVEIERTLTALYCFFLQNLDVNEAYKAFTSAQRNNREIKENEIINEENFNRIYEKTKLIIDEASKKNVLMYLIIYSDIGKSPRIKELLKALSMQTSINIDLSLDPDDLMMEILNKLDDDQINKVLPSFIHLSPTEKNMLREIYPIMSACLGHLYFLERGEKTLQLIR